MARPRNPRVHETSETIAAMVDSAEPGQHIYALAVIPPDDMPDHLQGIPDQARVILCLRARGLTFQQIGARVGIAWQSARDMYLRYDPQGVFYVNPETRAKLAEQDWEIAQAQAVSRALSGVDDLSPMQAVTMAGIAADKLRDIKRLQMEDKRIDMVVDNSSLAGLRAIDVESSEPEPA